ncbi:MAG: winged helix-turn-helix transcriptional regulator [Desulfobacteraceae bacterium]|nr:winged helix-turn-helix transcriptional regulator [Desulfobacteraceae bacterium]
MDINKLNQLRLLEEIEGNNNSSQRDFSNRLNISLGLVNAFIKRLVNKGYCKVTSIPKKRVKYILTPKGAAEKTKLTYEYILYSYNFYKAAQDKILDLFNELEASNVKTVVFWGTGELAEIAYLLLNETSIKLVGMIDADHKGDMFKGINILHPEQLENLDFDKVIFTAMPDKINLSTPISDSIPNKKFCYLAG